MKNYLFLSLLFVAISCKKNDDPQVVLEHPVFKVSGTVNGQPLNIQAGVNDYIMYTDYTYDNAVSVFEFNGSLRKFNCASCANTLNIKIRNNSQTGSSQNIFPDSAFTTNYYAFKSTGGNPTAYAFIFKSQLGGGPAPLFHWDFGDGTTGDVDSIQHIYQHPGIYTVWLKVLYQNGCSDTLTNTFRIGVPGSVCRARFEPAIVNHTVSVTNSSIGSGTLSYQWNFGDGTTSTQHSPVHTYTSSGVYKISLTTSDTDNHSSEYNRKIFIIPQTDCMASYLYPDWVTLNNQAALSNTTIEWTDSSGTLYSSSNGMQNDSCFFKINSVENYSANSNGDPVKKLNIRFHSRLYNSSQSAYVDLDVSEGVIGVAYK